MRVLWISFLLIGSITCVPVGKDSGSNSGDVMPLLTLPAFIWSSGRGESSDSGSSSSQPSLLNPNPNFAQAPGVHSGYFSVGAGSDSGAYAAPVSGGYYGSAPAGGYGGSYSSPSAGAGSYGFGSAPRDESWSSGSVSNYGVSQDTQEPVFSDVSDLEPVYSFGSRSSYQRGRAVFAQSHYTPGEPVFEPVPQYDPVGKTPPKQTQSIW